MTDIVEAEVRLLQLLLKLFHSLIFLAADLDEPRLHPMPILPRLNLQPPMIGVPAIPANSISLNDPEEDPFEFHDGPRHNLAPRRIAEEYGVYILPEVQLPANWDAPL